MKTFEVDYQKGKSQPWSIHQVLPNGERHAGKYFRDMFALIKVLPGRNQWTDRAVSAAQ